MPPSSLPLAAVPRVVSHSWDTSLMQRFSYLAGSLLCILKAIRSLIWIGRGPRSISKSEPRLLRAGDEQDMLTPTLPGAARRLTAAVAVAVVLLLSLLYGSGAIQPVFAQDARLTTEAAGGSLGDSPIQKVTPLQGRPSSGLRQDSTTAPLTTTLPSTATLPFTTTPTISDFGLAFVNSAESHSGTQRIQRGVDTGVTTDRFPIYWEQVEKSIGTYTWTSQDTAIRANESLGMDTLAILLGTPRQYRFGSRAVSVSLGGSFIEAPANQAPRSEGCDPQEAGGECNVIEGTTYFGEQLVESAGAGEENPDQPDLRAQSGSCSRSDGPPAPFNLWKPIFVNGSDEPSDGTRISPTNPWARFVGAAVTRYKPGGEAGTNIRHWEIWNEPDLCHFWSGTPQEFARLLKVAYIVIKWIDADAYVVFGGLAHFANGQWLFDMLDALQADSLSEKYDGFFDAAGSHHYSLSYVGYQYTSKVRSALDRRGWTGKSIWITESGVPVCNDYPGPTCPSPWRASANEQASYIWQNIAYTQDWQAAGQYSNSCCMTTAATLWRSIRRTVSAWPRTRVQATAPLPTPRRGWPIRPSSWQMSTLPVRRSPGQTLNVFACAGSHSITRRLRSAAC